MSKVVFTVGLPASGKSLYAETYYSDSNWIVVSSDKVRKQLWGDETEQKNPSEVFGQVMRQVKSALKEKLNVVIDATNIKQKQRKGLLSQIPKEVERECLVFCVSIENCLNANQKRSRKVPREVIYKMWRQFEPPAYEEGFDRIRYISRDIDVYETLDELMTKNIETPHDNPNHSLSCGEHCLQCEKIMMKKLLDFNHFSVNEITALLLAARYHDLSKFKVKSFINYKGEVTENHAHYYNHANVSAYDFLCAAAHEMEYNEELFELTSNLIANHMIFFDKNAIAKKTKIYSSKFMEMLSLLNECDRFAH